MASEYPFPQLRAFFAVLLALPQKSFDWFSKECELNHRRSSDEMFIATRLPLMISAKSEMLSISLFAEMIRAIAVAINISPLCGDDSIHILQGTNRRDF